jgi:hypothetical protein
MPTAVSSRMHRVGVVPATLKLERQAFGFELRRGTFSVLVDGQEVGSIAEHSSVEFPLDPGYHSVKLSAGRYSSPIRSFDATDGRTVTFQCHGARIWPMYLASIVKPDLAISLRQASD